MRGLAYNNPANADAIRVAGGIAPLVKLLGDSDIEIPYNTEFDKIYKKVKQLCQFSRISEDNGVSKACYKCNDSKFNGEVGFVVLEGMGAIHFTKLLPN